MNTRLLVPLSILVLVLSACDRAAASGDGDGASAAPPAAQEGEAAPPAAPAAPAGEAAAPAAAAAASATAVECSTAADAFPGAPGTRITVRCPAGCGQGSVWGTDLYSDDSAICVAAVHAGVITVQEGGTVEFFVATGATHYPPSTRNGVTTLEWPEWQRSFAFPAAHPTDRPVSATCFTRAQHLAGPTHVVECPAGCTGGQVWGTDLYSDDSMICSAAIHAGVLPANAAGTVSLEIAPGAPSYAASARHGVTSSPWPEWGRSFRVAAR